MSQKIPRRYPCRWEGCHREATCLPRLYVPASKFSPNAAAEAVTSMMGLPLCDLHFPRFTARRLLDGGGGQAIKDAISAEFRKRNAFPDFAKAAIGRISDTDTDFGRFEIMQEKARAN